MHSPIMNHKEGPKPFTFWKGRADTLRHSKGLDSQFEGSGVSAGLYLRGST
jgi:hypothetical protein